MLPHFKSLDKYNSVGEYCQICGKSGNPYWFGSSRDDINLYCLNLCEKHYKTELRKYKLKKLNKICQSQKMTE
jgi:hypothetical protein